VAITDLDQKLICFGLIANISDTGAKFLLPGRADVPDRFLAVLYSKSGPLRNCEVVWRGQTQIGARFLSAVALTRPNLDGIWTI
jgi:hypothetical protein